MIKQAQAYVFVTQKTNNNKLKAFSLIHYVVNPTTIDMDQQTVNMEETNYHYKQKNLFE